MSYLDKGLAALAEAPVGNYYGTPYVAHRDGKYLFGIEDYDGPVEVEVSRTFAEAFIGEFGRIAVPWVCADCFVSLQDWRGDQPMLFCPRCGHSLDIEEDNNA